MNSNPPSHEAIAARAYRLWERAGRPAGRDQEFWSRAEAELVAPANIASAPPVMSPPIVPRPPTPVTEPGHQVPPRSRGPKPT